MSQVEAKYDQFLSGLKQELPKVDTDLVMKVMYFERKFPRVEPKVDLDIEFVEGTNLNVKKFEINARYGFQTSLLGHHGLFVSGRMSLETIITIAQVAQ